MGWFFGFKLHLLINDKGEVLNFVLNQANVDDRDPLKNEKFVEKIKVKGYVEKGTDIIALCERSPFGYFNQEQYEKCTYEAEG